MDPLEDGYTAVVIGASGGIGSAFIKHLQADGRKNVSRNHDPRIMALQFAVNATGPALALKHLAPLLPRRRRGIFATLSARVGSIEDNRHGGWISYRASKAALNQIVRTAALEMRWRQPHAICVSLQPGTVNTRLSAPWYTSDGSDLLTPAESTRRMLQVLDGLDTTASGGFHGHAGERIPG